MISQIATILFHARREVVAKSGEVGSHRTATTSAKKNPRRPEPTGVVKHCGEGGLAVAADCAAAIDRLTGF